MCTLFPPAGNLVYCYVQSDGLGAVAITDKVYPARVAVSMLKDTLAAFKAVHAVTWRAAKEDYACKFPKLEEILAQYQEPAQVDKIMKLNNQLAETKEMLVKTIDKVLERGEKLDDLVEKSNSLSQQSKMFYKSAKKTNSCCVVM
jgi:synaptobrevin homolog YKT6